MRTDSFRPVSDLSFGLRLAVLSLLVVVGNLTSRLNSSGFRTVRLFLKYKHFLAFADDIVKISTVIICAELANLKLKRP